MLSIRRVLTYNDEYQKINFKCVVVTHILDIALAWNLKICDTITTYRRGNIETWMIQGVMKKDMYTTCVCICGSFTFKMPSRWVLSKLKSIVTEWRLTEICSSLLLRKWKWNRYPGRGEQATLTTWCNSVGGLHLHCKQRNGWVNMKDWSEKK